VGVLVREYAVTQEAATEPAFDNEFWDKKEAGIYVDIVSGEPLFASPRSSTADAAGRASPCPSSRANVVENQDRSHGMIRTEVRSAHGDSHLGHVFNDGPPTRVACAIASTRPPCASSLRGSRGRGVRRVPKLFDETDQGGGGPAMSATTEKAILAGGCFWGMQDLIRKRPGVVSTRVGLHRRRRRERHLPQPRDPRRGDRDHLRPDKTSYREILEFFFQIHDPTTKNRQGNDVGLSYRSAIFYVDDEQRRVAEDTIADVEASGSGPARS
jgi:methionine-R-sulfoxide reductase/methionine-S-sulfoxide reductase